MTGRRGKHLLRVYGNKDIWNMESLKEFVAAVIEVVRAYRMEDRVTLQSFDWRALRES